METTERAEGHLESTLSARNEGEWLWLYTVVSTRAASLKFSVPQMPLLLLPSQLRIINKSQNLQGTCEYGHYQV